MRLSLEPVEFERRRHAELISFLCCLLFNLFLLDIWKLIDRGWQFVFFDPEEFAEEFLDGPAGAISKEFRSKTSSCFEKISAEAIFGKLFQFRFHLNY